MPDFLTLLQEAKWQRAIREVTAAAHDIGIDDKVTGFDVGFQAELALVIFPVILDLVQEWKLDGLPSPLTMENFPASDKLAASSLVAWLVGEINAMHEEASTVPLA